MYYSKLARPANLPADYKYLGILNGMGDDQRSEIRERFQGHKTREVKLDKSYYAVVCDDLKEYYDYDCGD